MAGERSVRISFEAREQLSRAINKVNEALGDLQTEALESGAALSQGLERGADSAESGLGEISDEANKATISLSALSGRLEVLEGELANVGDGEIDIKLDEPEEATVAEVRNKVAARLKASEDPLLDIDADVDESELGEALEKADMRIKAQRPASRIDLDIDDSDIIQEVEEAEQAVNNTLGDDVADIELDAKLSEDSKANVLEETNEIVELAEESADDIELTADIRNSALTDIPAKTQTLVELAESAAEDITLDVDIDATEDAVQLAMLVSQMNDVQSEALQTAAASQVASQSLNRMGDNAEEAGDDMGALATAMSLMSLNTTALSLNLGAFNIALSNLATQIPILIGSLGSLVTVLGGVVGASAAAAAGIGGIVAGGAISETQRLQEEFSNINNSAEAMQAIMQSLADAFSKALAPLTELEGATQSFYDVINGLLTAVNAFAKGIAESFRFSRKQMEEFTEVGKDIGVIEEEMSSSAIDEEIMSIGEFMDELGRIWSENVQGIISGIQIMSAFMLPILADIFEFVAQGFDDMAVFITKVTKRLTSGEMRTALNNMLDFAVKMIDLGSKIIVGLLPVFSGMLAIGKEVAQVFNSLNTDIVKNIGATLLLGVAFFKLYNVANLLYGGLLDVATSAKIGKAASKSAAAAKYAHAAASWFLQTRLATLIGVSHLYAASQRVAAAATGGLTRRTYLAISAMTLFLPQLLKAHAYVLRLAAGYAAQAASSAAATTQQWLLNSSIAGTSLVAKAASLALSGLKIATLATAAAGFVLTASLAAILIPLAAIVAAGALVVGVMGNMESATSGLGSLLGMIKSVLAEVANMLLESMVVVWNSLYQIFQAILMPIQALIGGFTQIGRVLGILGGEGTSAGGALSFLFTIFDALLTVVEIFFGVIGAVATFLGTILTGYITVVFKVLKTLISIIKAVITAFMQFTAIGGFIGGFIDGIVGAVSTLIDALMAIPQVAASVFNAFMKLFEIIVNNIIVALNHAIGAIPKEVRAAAGIEKLDKVDMTVEKGDMTKEDVVGEDSEDSSQAEEEVTPERGNQFNYNEENVNNTSMEVNADPEDKGTISRVVKDAMEEADSFNRRRQGFTGN